MDNKNKETFLVTSALPYANGSLHIGHIAGAYLPADIFVRYNRMKGNNVVYICGSDEHGAPISIRAKQENIDPRSIINCYYKKITDNFKSLDIVFDHFSRTSNKNHHNFSKEFFTKLYKNNYISMYKKNQFYCEHDKIFLPDRFLIGICPKCNSENARGDECYKCNSWIEADKIINPKCKLCNKAPILKLSKHWYLKLDKIENELKEWLNYKNNLKNSVKQFALNFLKEGLKERSITRDLNWGIKVPLKEAENKVMYVWFDAPIGYISATKEWSEKIGQPDLWKNYWMNPKCKLIHFIGKDNIPFHILFWPAIIMGQKENYILPYDIPANEHLKIEGKKLSTSDKNVIWVDDFIKIFPSDYLRYYLASIAPENKDSNFSWKHFQEKINSELNNVLGNFINRTLKFIERYFNNSISITKSFNELDQEFLSEIKKYPEKIDQLLNKFKVKESISEIMQMVHIGNRYFDSQKPWNLIKNNKEHCKTVLHNCILLVKMLSPLLYPFIPKFSQELWQMIGENGEVKNIQWNKINELSIIKNELKKVRPLIKKIDNKIIDNLIEEFNSKKCFSNKLSENNLLKQNKNKEVSIDDFKHFKFKIATIIDCVKIEKSNKLLKFKINLGNEIRQVISGVAKNYSPETLIGKQVLVLSNLKKIKLFNENSEAMILFAQTKKGLTIISPENYVEPGSIVS